MFAIIQRQNAETACVYDSYYTEKHHQEHTASQIQAHKLTNRLIFRCTHSWCAIVANQTTLPLACIHAVPNEPTAEPYSAGVTAEHREISSQKQEQTATEQKQTRT